ncbi:glycosyl transferase family 1 [Pseudotenacibaculum sp. MALMAid0570]|uniref:glycosyl transferase family 1 n=1 Tax=Pseudotenacibaculum sp. MALMAid0570 TaxID=3143938 RepID=UPI0032DF6734
MKVLIITYYWPPAGGSGVQRWLKFVKYLQDFDITPVIYTVENSSYAIQDDILEKEIPKNVEVIRRKIFEPNNFGAFLGTKNKKSSAGFLNPKPGILGKALRYIRANYFIPDARKFWIKPSIKFLKKHIPNQGIDLIITTGPPHSLHLIGLQLKKELNMKWISDFRDPWTEIDYFHHLPLTKASLNKHQDFEKEVAQYSDQIIVIGNAMKDYFSSLNKNTVVITNGYDNEIKKDTPFLDDSFTITHVGMMNSDRNPKVLWNVLKELCDEHKDFKSDLIVRLIGKVSIEVEKSILDLENNVDNLGYLNHHEIQKYQNSTQLLLLCINNVPKAKGIITGKIFEYLQAKRPILAIGPEDGDAADILNQTDSGKIFGFENKRELKKHILELYKLFKKNKLVVNSKDIQKYHRKELTRKLAKVIHQTIEKN